MTHDTQTLRRMANAIRFLSVDAIEKSKSGHPGMPLGMADVATVLFTEFLKYSPLEPYWEDRDRFVLSAGHGSMLLYSLLYLTGYEDMTLEDIKDFRQLHSKTAGHPEYGEADGIETTTGPLGQGLATAVGMALAEKHQEARFGKDFVDHHTYALVGDGCLMEGIAQEAISFAGHQKLSKLIVLFDDNQITIDGPTSLTTSEDHRKRFEACGWDVFEADGHDFDSIRTALKAAKASENPAMIAFRTTIGYGAPTKAGSSKSHGSPLGAEERKGLAEALDWPHQPFEIPEDILDLWRDRDETASSAWHDQPLIKDFWERMARAYEEDLDEEPGEETQADEFFGNNQPFGFELPDEALQAFCQKHIKEKTSVATRKSSQDVLDVLAKDIPQLVGGSADLTGSNNTKAGGMEPLTAENPEGRYIYYGIREHAMGAIMNGMALHGGIIPYGGTFLTFSDYCRPSIRLAALMRLRSIFVMTHDSIGLGEDGPTHQPIEHLMSLRAMPNLQVFRPADAVETAEAWYQALLSPETPSVIALSRQNLPTLRETHGCAGDYLRGAYVLAEEEKAQLTLLATGSEVSLALKVKEELEKHSVISRVVSMPCWEIFEEQDEEYQEAVLGNAPRVSIEAGTTFGWDRYLESDGLMFGIDTFGASAPAADLYEHFSLTPESITETILEYMKD